MSIFNFNKHTILIILIQMNIGFVGIGQGSVILREPASVTAMMEEFVLYGKTNEKVKAWRIQIITTDDRREMETAKSKFISIYPDISLEWKHIVPYYQVRVGAFYDKNKMMPFLLELKKTFPAATPVYDHISKKTLVNK
ncbi:MAG: hypothetical protein IPK25_04650 [Saprospiraceae bacterium]|nr:hypothetical protein [Saprospiraceae bacterium]